MLRALAVKNVGVIEETEVSFGSGLVVLTGETGAGKSLVLEALGLLSGARASPQVVRSGAEAAVVEGVFELTDALRERLEALGLPADGAEVSVRRVVEQAGRGRVHVNGALTTVSVLRQLMHGLLEVAGQHEHLQLLEPAKQLGLIDALAPAASVAAVRAAWESIRETEGELERLGGDDRQADARRSLVEFQLQELETLSPKPGEDEALELERRRLSSVERVRRALQESTAALDAEGGALDALARSITAVREAAAVEPRAQALEERLRSLQLELEDSARGLDRLCGGLEADPARLAQVEDRLDALRRLTRKHAMPLEAVLARGQTLREELEQLAARAQRRTQLQGERGAKLEVARKAAAELSRERGAVLARLTAGVREHLSSLRLAGARFEASLAPAPLGPNGVDEVRLQFSANVGEALRPLEAVASGGEASRLLLAVRAAVAPGQGPGCVVLDEADQGVGGAAAEAVGRLIQELGRHRQVLCVTHSPQVAAFADAHLKVEKALARGRTTAGVTRLDAEGDRLAELARMLSGAAVGPEARAAAAALVRSAHRGRGPRRRPAVRAVARTIARPAVSARSRNAALP